MNLSGSSFILVYSPGICDYSGDVVIRYAESLSCIRIIHRRIAPHRSSPRIPISPTRPLERIQEFRDYGYEGSDRREVPFREMDQ